MVCELLCYIFYNTVQSFVKLVLHYVCSQYIFPNILGHLDSPRWIVLLESSSPNCVLLCITVCHYVFTVVTMDTGVILSRSVVSVCRVTVVVTLTSTTLGAVTC